MNTATLIQNARLVFPGESIRTGSLLVENGRISALDPVRAQEATVVDAGGRLLTPGMIDVHTHGIRQWIYERSPEDIRNGARELARFGTTCVLPTLYQVMNRESFKKLALLTEAMVNAEGVCVPGFHLEGPFLALPGAGAQTIPGDVKLLEDILTTCRGRVCAMSISPDTPQIIPVIERLRERGITPFITHTKANAEQTVAAIQAGARHATHFYDVFPVPIESDPGVRPVGAVETVLADRRVTVDFIADGTHVHPMAIRCAVAAKGWQGVVLITDSNIGAGMPDGEYPTPWGYPVIIGSRGGARIADPKHPYFGALAGSALTMNIGMRNLLKWLDLPAAQVWAMGTLNTARMLGLDRKGRLAIGADADLVLWDEDLQPNRTWVDGRLVYERK